MERNHPSEPTTHPSVPYNPLKSTRTQLTKLKLRDIRDINRRHLEIYRIYTLEETMQTRHYSTTHGYPRNKRTSENKMKEYSNKLLLFTPKEISQIPCQISKKNYYTEFYIWKSILGSSDRTLCTDYHNVRKLEIPPVVTTSKFTTTSMFWKILSK
jgi:hypothetical protein